MLKKIIKDHVFRIIDVMPAGTRFTTQDIKNQIRCRSSTVSSNSVGAIIKQRHDVINSRIGSGKPAVWVKQ